MKPFHLTLPTVLTFPVLPAVLSVTTFPAYAVLNYLNPALVSAIRRSTSSIAC